MVEVDGVIEKNNFVQIEECNKDTKELIRMGIKGDLKLAVMNGKTSNFQFLSRGQLQKIYSAHPERTFISLIRGVLSSSKKSFHRLPYDQKINFLDLWVDSTNLDEIINKTSENASNNEPSIALEKSPYWLRLNKLFMRAISEYPAWKEQEGRVKKTANLNQWLRNVIGADTREAEIIKKILSDFFKELK